jgi:hypothetical protein
MKRPSSLAMSDSDSPPTSRDAFATPVAAPTTAPRVGAPVAETARRGTGLAWLWAGVGLALIILAGGFVGWLLLVRPAEKAAGGLRDTVASALEKITGERFTVSSNTVTLQKANISELNVIQRKTQTMTKLETTMFGSKATLILRGDFVVKAGYDLTQPLSVTVNDTTGEVKADFPPPKITSVELKNYEVYFSDNGLINKITPEHQELATKQMLAQARLDAEKSDIKEEAEIQLQTRLKDLLGRDAKKIMVRETQVLP